MSFGGHVLDMIKRTNANNALREKYRAKKDKTTNNRWKSEVNDKISEEKEISEEELERIKSAIRSKLRKTTKTKYFNLWYLYSVVVFVVFWVYFS
ncbi:conserved hypothetical protein [Capnocytophaga canimorsus]|uniref:Uncharacterized protein n=1 Tax=Capnocytophaga canimorsus TaxID=28188 RepID=A0A0B7H825_9FLAO|nr:hypothetical protein [Capnocytophaga canimorsus]CEN35530.1 conserved hypothetical protein [Capnocytophaga canimorsus]